MLSPVKKQTTIREEKIQSILSSDRKKIKFSLNVYKHIESLLPIFSFCSQREIDVPIRGSFWIGITSSTRYNLLTRQMIWCLDPSTL